MRIPKHPGRLLKEEIEARDLSANKLASALGVPANRISDIIRERRNVTAETALRLARFFGNSPEFWLRLQIKHDLGKANAEQGAEIRRTVRKAA
ncbi:MAG: HigA family addiction module antitoxin [Proteobacteria bacterium]|nr:HigA family addiction module antitoxin [Pseudomonadota bacterium]